MSGRQWTVSLRGETAEVTKAGWWIQTLRPVLFPVYRVQLKVYQQIPEERSTLAREAHHISNWLMMFKKRNANFHMQWLVKQEFHILQWFLSKFHDLTLILLLWWKVSNLLTHKHLMSNCDSRNEPSSLWLKEDVSQCDECVESALSCQG